MSNLVLDASQQEAVEAVHNSFKRGNPNTTLVLGRAGCGKSTVINAVISNATKNCIRTIVLAPTARAVAEVEDKLGHVICKTPCMTIHKFFRRMDKTDRKILPDFIFQPGTGGLVVIDEVGMLSADMLFNLMYAKFNGRLNVRYLLCGDIDQLPPVNGKPFYTLEPFVEDMKKGSVQFVQLRGNHRNGSCDKLREVLSVFETGVLTRRARAILDAVANKPWPKFVWLYTALTHEGLHTFNKRQVVRSIQEWPSGKRLRQVLLTPSRYPDKTCTFIPEYYDDRRNVTCEGTRCILTQNIYIDDVCVAANGDFGVVVQLLCDPDDDGTVQFSNKHKEAVRIRLDRTLKEVDIDARQIEKRVGESSRIKCWVVDICYGFAGTIHTQQGRTIKSPRTLIVNFDKATPEGMLVALSRVESIEQLRFDCYTDDPEVLNVIFRRPSATKDKVAFLKHLELAPERSREYSKTHLLGEFKSRAKKRRCLGF